MRARRRAGIRMRMRIISIRVISILRLVYASASVAAGARVEASLCLFNGEGLRASLRDHLYLINQKHPPSPALLDSRVRRRRRARRGLILY